MSRASREEWAKRVQRWRDSDLSGPEFAAEIGVNVRTLRYWSWKLGKEAVPPSTKTRPRPERRSATVPSFVEVAPALLGTDTGLELVVAERYVIRVWKDGTSAVLLDPLDLISRLCALIPPPRFHMVRYHGVLAGNAAARAEVVPGREPVADEQLALFTPADGGPLQPPPPTRHPWAWLLRRVFAVEMTQCPTCAGRMRLLDVVTDPDDIARALGERGHARAPPRRPAPGQLELDFGAA